MTGFIPALLDPAAAVPPGLVDPAGRPAGRRFDVYRNNVVVSLIEAMAVGFPVIEKLVGPEFFAAMAGVFVRAHPPRSPVLATYGDHFPAFLEGFAPVAHLPYLADVARLELSLRESYHAADSTPIAPDALETPQLTEAALHLAPACRLLASPYPIHAIWKANTDPDAPQATGGAQTVFVARPAYDPVAVAVDDPTARWLAALTSGLPFGAAIEAAGDGFDLATALTLLLETNSITEIEVPQ